MFYNRETCDVTLPWQLNFRPVTQTLDSAIYRINHSPADKYYGNQLRYLVDSAIQCLNNRGLDLNKTETAIFIFERWKKSMGYRFVPECNHAQESHLSIFSFSLPYLQDHSLLRSRNVANMVTRRNDSGSSLLV